MRGISANLYLIAIYLSDCWKFLGIRPLRLKVRTIKAAYPSIIITEYLPDCFIRVTVLLEYFDLW